MKKRFLLGMLTGVLMLGLMACGPEETEEVESSSKEATESQIEETKEDSSDENTENVESSDETESGESTEAEETSEVEKTVETSEVKETSASASETQDTGIKEDSYIPLYMSFVNGEGTVYIDEKGRDYSFEEMVATLCQDCATENQEITVKNMKYTFADSYEAGRCQLMIWVDFRVANNPVTQFHIIKFEDGAIRLLDSQLGGTGETKAYEELQWLEGEVKESWKQIGGYVEEKSNNVDYYARYELEKTYNDVIVNFGPRWRADRIYLVGNYALLYYGNNPLLMFHDGKYASQTSCIDMDNKERIIECTVLPGDPGLDAIMKAAGYDDYRIEYFYTYDVFRDFNVELNAPQSAIVYAGGEVVRYDFHDQLFICKEVYESRFTLEALANADPNNGIEILSTEFNPEITDLIRGIYKYGIYYGEWIVE